jgi:colanic acid/amylovoran biosynthesis glycosyltransferase
VNTDFAGRRVEALGCPSAKIHKVPSALNPDDFPFRERHYEGGAVRITTVGRLVEKKGIEYSIRAVARVLEKHSNLHYDVVGDGPLRGHLEELVQQMGVGGHVHFHGAQSSSYVQRIVSDAQIFVLASITARDGDEESLGNVLLEAQASGLPVVVTDYNGFPEAILPGRSGFLVPERDVESLAERIEHLVEHPEMWATMGRAGRAHVEQRYNSHAVNSKLVELYKRTIRDYRRCALPS